MKGKIRLIVRKPFSIEKWGLLRVFRLAFYIVLYPARVVLFPAVAHILGQRLHLSGVVLARTIIYACHVQRTLFQYSCCYQCAHHAPFDL